MSARPKEEEHIKKDFVEEVIAPTSRSVKVNLTDLVKRLKKEKKIERNNNILISVVAVSAVAVLGIILTL
tara:strand:+ start:153 stop:362 length:210 start_codon:yes stop_codon:yes gene_type:complete